MAGLGQRKRKSGDINVEIDMVPVMNMFLVLIPFLLMSSSFLHIKAINTSVPVKSTQVSVPMEPKKSEIKLTAVVELAKTQIRLSASSSDLTEKQLGIFDQVLKPKDEFQYPLEQLTQALLALKNKYPKSDTLIMIPAANVTYNTIVQAMDAARRVDDKPLFPNVVISSKVE